MHQDEIPKLCSYIQETLHNGLHLLVHSLHGAGSARKILGSLHITYNLWPTHCHSKSSKGCGKPKKKTNLSIYSLYPSDHHIRLSYLVISNLKTSQTSCTSWHFLASCTQLQFRKSKIRSVPSWPQVEDTVSSQLATKDERRMEMEAVVQGA